jgi:DNA-binding NtrC family response regulator
MATVLIVEDVTQVLLLAESVLQEAGYDTLSASTLAEAQAILQSGQKIELLFTDIELGDQREAGLLVGALASQAHQGVRVIYTTVHGVTDRMIALFAAPHAFLPKPWKPERLVGTVAGLLSKAARGK